MKTLERKVFAARLALFWERLWPSCFHVLMVGGMFMLATLTGVFELMSRTVHIGALAAFAVALVWALRPVFPVRWPGRAEALRHLEAASRLPHRPASSWEDTLSRVSDDSASRSVWLRHKQRLADAIARLRPAWPVSRMRNRDPFALRAALLLCLAVAIAWTGGDWRSRMSAALVPNVHGSVPVWLDAWVKPPGYTAMPPIFLSGQNTIQSVSQRQRVAVPTGSEIVIRVNGAEAPHVLIENEGVPAGEAVSRALAQADGVHELRMTLTHPGTVSVFEGQDALETWTFDIIPDAPPRVDVVDEIQRTVNNALRFTYSASDDYGVAAVRSEFALTDEQDGEVGVASSNLLTIEPPDFPLSLPSRNPRTAEQVVYQDLTAHPWAGLAVQMTLVANDQAGNEARSETYTFRLPEREFSEPLARAIIEQRRTVILEPEHVDRVVLALDAMSVFPDGLFPTAGTYLGMRHVLNRLESGDDDSLADSIELMWELALSIEDGDLSAAERELRNAQRALQEALARDASEEEIAELMDRLREAVNRYMQAMVEQAQRNGEQAQRAPDGARELRPQDFDNLLDTIENLARAGANDAAQEMLAQLQNMLENMQAGRGQGSMSQRDSEMARMLEQLGELMGDQQQLMDDTYGSQQQQGTEGPGARGGSSSEFQELSELQEGLAQTLEDILSGLQRRGVEGPSSLGQAEEAMRDAIEALRQNDREGAVGEQGEALDQLREGAQAMAQQMLQGDGSQGALGRHGRGANDENRDPLGRPLNSSGPELGLSTEVPSEIEIQRARKILRELQDRVGDRQRPQVELEYLDRLLDRF